MGKLENMEKAVLGFSIWNLNERKTYVEMVKTIVNKSFSLQQF